MLARSVGTEIKGKAGPHFFDWEEAQKGLKAPIQMAAETR